jgi:2'-5' RNA ligase
LRCFVAIDVPPDVRDAVVRAQVRIRRDAGGADVRWTEPAQIHLTLAFLGAVSEGRVPDVSAALDAVTAAAAPVPLAVAGLGAFPSARRPRIVWAGVGGDVAALRALAEDVQHALAPLGFVPDGRPFRAHVTVGRARTPRGAGALAAAIHAAHDVELGAWTADEVVLYESRLRPAGALHVPVSRHPLRGPRA